jgi:ABC-2 type transport system permease protein
MKNLPALVRVGLKSNFGLAVLRYRFFKQRKDIWMAPLILLGVIGVVPTLYGYVLLISGLFRLLQPIGQEQAVLTLAVLAGQFLVLVFGLFYVISAFYFSRDLEILIPLPLRPFEVMISKFAVILVNEYLTIGVLVLPAFAIYGVLARSGPAFWIASVLIFLLLPVIPLAIVSILAVGLMRIVNLSRKKDALIVVGSLILIAAVIALQYWLGRSARSRLDAEAALAVFTSADGLFVRIGSWFPPSVWATRALVWEFPGRALAGLLELAGLSIALFAGIVILAERLFYRGLIGLEEVSGRKRGLSRTAFSRRVTSGYRPVRAIFGREWRIMNRTPIFLLNGVLTAVLFPVIFVVMAKSSSGSGDFPSLFRALFSAKSIYFILGAAAFMAACGSLNGTASSAFSREGGQFWISKVIPVTPRKQVIAKFLHSYAIAAIGIAAGGAALVAVIRISASAWLTAAALAFLASIALTAVGMIIDLARPLLDWTNPMRAIKQNLNVLLGILADAGILTGVGFCVRLLARAGLPEKSLIPFVFAVSAFLSATSGGFLLWFAENRYRDLEV